MVQRDFLTAPDDFDGLAKGDACVAGGFVTLDFGFLASRLPFC
jgi:hypothetical protein